MYMCIQSDTDVMHAMQHEHTLGRHKSVFLNALQVLTDMQVLLSRLGMLNCQ